ncbi:MAG: ABC transporter ATP-binding protein [Clostridia bacterium]|nr:ABC transporter ATP-binding protein [Clostridia bacterium]
MKTKRTFKENMAMIMRGYRIVFKIYRRSIFWSIFTNITGILSPYFALYMSALVIDELAYSRDAKRLLLLAIISVGGLFLLNLAQRLIQGRANVYGSDTWRKDMYYYMETQNKMQYDHLENPDVVILRQKIFAAKNATGAGLSVLLWNINAVCRAIVNIILSVSLTVSMFKLVEDHGYEGFFAFINSPYSILVVLTLIFLNVIVSITTGNVLSKKVRKAYEDLAESNSLFSFLMKFGSDITIFNMRRQILSEYNKKLRRPSFIFKDRAYSLKYGSIRMIWDFIMTAVLFIFVAAKAYIGVFGIGSFILYRGTIAKFIDGISTLAERYGYLIENNDAMERVFEFLDLPDDMYHGTLSVEKREDIDYEIEFRDVSFKYPRSENWALRHVNMKFKIGDRMAVVGMNGSGKTTFIKLLCRLYDPTEGKILLNGIDITRYKYDEYMKIFSVVFQDYKLFAFSIAENVAADLNYDREKVLSCLERVGLGKRISELERGIETPLYRDYENDGIDVSGGEAQKIAIARALYKDAPFIILDEPTAALDPLAEAEIYSQFNEIVENKTAIYISHRLSSCRFCNNIVVFDHGTIVQQGGHEELVADEKGKYHELWHAQAQYYTEKTA